MDNREELAQRLITNPLWEESWDTLEKELIERWRNTGAGAAEQREQLYIALRTANKVRKEIEHIFKIGQAEEAGNG